MPHLSYVGDATIGEQTNIGAATVFVNYDGVNKHRTVIGEPRADRLRHNMFVAPVEVGDGAYTAAGQRDHRRTCRRVRWGSPGRASATSRAGWSRGAPAPPSAEAAQRAARRSRET